MPTLYSLLFVALLQPAPKTGFVEGTVVDAVSGAPLAQATVNVRYEKAPDGSGRLTSQNERGNTAETGIDGRFRLGAVAGIPFHFAVTRKGYTSINERFGHEDPNPYSLEPGREKTGVVIALQSESSLAGTVFDPEVQKPVEGITVRALRRARESGNEYWAPTQQAKSGADGRYVIGALPPGEYRLFLTSNLAPKLIPAPPEPSPPVFDYPPVYYPGVADGPSALPVNLMPGASLGSLDVKISRRRLYSIRGEVKLDGSPTPVAFFSIAPFGEDGQVHRRIGVLDAPGPFEILNLQEGPLKLSAVSTPAGGVLQALALHDTVLQSDQDHVLLHLLPGTRASFAVSTYGLRDDAHDPLWTELKASCTVRFSPRARVRMGDDPAAKAGADGRGAVDNLFVEPVQVSVQGIPDGWLLRQVLYDGQPAEPYRVEMNPSAPEHLFRILLAPAANSISGGVREGSAAAAQALVLVVREPFDQDTIYSRMKRATADGDGRFSFRTLHPGAWRILAVPAASSWQAANMLILSGAGEKVDVPESGSISIQLDARK